MSKALSRTRQSLMILNTRLTGTSVSAASAPNRGQVTDVPQGSFSGKASSCHAPQGWPQAHFSQGDHKRTVGLRNPSQLTPRQAPS